MTCVDAPPLGWNVSVPPSHSCEPTLRNHDWKTKARVEEMVPERAEKSMTAVESFSSKLEEDSLTNYSVFYSNHVFMKFAIFFGLEVP